MHQIRTALLALAAVSLLSSCGAPQQATQAPDQIGDLVAWSSLHREDIKVPRGVSYAQATVHGVVAADISGVPEDAVSGGQTGGVAVRLPDSFENQASGAQIRVTVRALSSDDGAVMGVAYSTNEVGNSGWQRFALTSEPTNYVFGYVVPPKQSGLGDFLAFRSYGAGHVQIIGFKTEVVLPTSAQ